MQNTTAIEIIPMGIVPHEYHPDLGDLGRGKVVTPAEAADIEAVCLAHGWTPYHDSDLNNCFVYDRQGNKTGTIWRGWVKEEHGKHWTIAIEINPKSL